MNNAKEDRRLFHVNAKAAFVIVVAPNEMRQVVVGPRHVLDGIAVKYPGGGL